MIDTKVNLAAVNRRERRMTFIIAGLVPAVLVLSLLVAVLTFQVRDAVDLLEGRTPVIARIDEAERRAECVDRLSLRYQRLTALVVSAAVTDDEPTTAQIAGELARFGALLDLALAGDPCAALEEP